MGYDTICVSNGSLITRFKFVLLWVPVIVRVSETVGWLGWLEVKKSVFHVTKMGRDFHPFREIGSI